VHVKLGAQLEAVLAEPAYRDGVFTGRFAGTIPMPDAARRRHSVLLNLRLRDGKLAGQATAQTTEETVDFALTSYVERARRLAAR